MDSSIDSLNSSTASLQNSDENDTTQPSTWRPPRSHARSAINMVNAGGIAPSSIPTPSVPIQDINQALDLYSQQYQPGHPKSLSGIALRSLILGITLTSSLSLTAYLLLLTPSPHWRLPLFLTLLSLFHFLEFWTTARYNPPAASISSFLFTQNGSAYTIANLASIIEYILTSLLLHPTSSLPYTFLPSPLPALLLTLSLALIFFGQLTRTYAMISAGTNFNHIVQHRKSAEHKLVTTGIYAWFRHPSYFGYFWWGVATQVMMGNVVCGVGYAVVLWKFFSARIKGEERLLVGFFGEDYVRYRERSWVGIPFIG